MKLMLTNVRLSFPALFEPKTVNGEGEPRFSASFLMPKGDPQIKKIEDAITAVATEKWKSKAGEILAVLRKKDLTCLKDGSDPDKAKYDGYKDNMFVNAAAPANQRPLVIGQNRSPLVAADGKPYGGCYVNASIELWAQDNKFGKRVNASLKGVQFVKDGDAFAGGAPASVDEFDDVSAPSEESIA